VKAPRIVALLVLLAVVAFLCWFFLFRPPPPTGPLTVYYTKLDGSTLGAWTISQRPREANESSRQYLQYRALYAAIQAVAGPPSDVRAIRFPGGTHVNAVTVAGPDADVDLSSEVTHQAGTFGENGEFKALVYTLTGIRGIDAVQVTVDGRRLQTLPHGSLELDTPLRRSDW
jgi:spore germination protein GerM